MARRKTRKQSLHAYERLNERAGMSRKQVDKLGKNASIYGRSPRSFPNGKFRTFLESKCINKRVKVYKGLVVIMANTSNRIITAYPIPEEFMEEYEQYGKQ